MTGGDESKNAVRRAKRTAGGSYISPRLFSISVTSGRPKVR